MANLYESYCEIVGNINCSDFFPDGMSIKQLDESAEEKIKKIFEAHGKLACFVNLEKTSINLTRTFHSIGVYFLGLYLLKNGWINKIHNFNVNLFDFNFTVDSDIQLPSDIKKVDYVWALASLYHDVMTSRELLGKSAAYSEIGNNPFLTPSSFLNFNEILEQEKIHYTIFESYNEIENITKDVNIFTGSKNIYLPKYREELINGYFRKRLHDGCIDHGIVSGFIFYDALVKNYLKTLGRIRDSELQKRNEKFDFSGLTYRPAHLVLFKYIADAIIIHNIWRWNEKTKLDYFNFGIACDEFASRKKRLTPEKESLAFFLCLADTVEPLKFFEKTNPKEVLEKIDIDSIGEDEIKISITDDFSNAEDREKIPNWFSKLKSMEEWLAVTVDMDSEKQCTIKISKKNE